MKKLKRLYLLPIVLAMATAGLLAWLLLPDGYFVKALLVAGIPLLVLGIGFRIITYQRISAIRSQLYGILETLEEFDVDEPRKVAFEESSFPIFNEFNAYLIELIDRIRDNYQANKQFTQNASHELQTPLAVIKGHVELLLQSPRIGEKEIESLGILLQNVNRLAKLNSALILLSKIEHQRFSDTEVVDFTRVTKEVLRNFKDLINIQELEVQLDFNDSFQIEMSETLAEIMIANLVQNAIRHNVENGYIEIKIENHYFQIRNSGQLLSIPPEKLFGRFKRKSNSEQSLGLGLSIIQRICEQSGLDIKYTSEKTDHQLVIRNQ